MRATLYVNGVQDDYMLGAKLVDSVSERVPYIEIEVDNSDNQGASRYGYYDEVEFTLTMPSDTEYEYPAEVGMYELGGSTADMVYVQFRGLIESMDAAHGDTQSIVLKCRGYALVMMEQAIDVLDYTSEARSAIVENLRLIFGAAYSGSVVITGNHIDATADSVTKTVKGKSPWDAIMDLCLEAGYDAWVDEEQDLHFTPREWTHSGLTIDTASYVFSVRRVDAAREVINRIMFFGGGTPQIVAQMDDYESQDELGVIKTKVVIDSSITDQATANERASAELAKYSSVPTRIVIDGTAFEGVKVGQIVTVNLPGFDIVGDYYLMEKSYEFPEDRYTLDLHAYTAKFEDTILEVIRELRRQRETETSEISTKLMKFTERIVTTPKIFASYRTAGSTWTTGLHDTGADLGFGSSTAKVLGYSSEGAETVVVDELT